MDHPSIGEIVRSQRRYFTKGPTRDVAFRVKKLEDLKSCIIDNEGAIVEALRRDLGKSEFEAYVGEIALVVDEVEHAIKHVGTSDEPCAADRSFFYGICKNFAGPSRRSPTTGRGLVAPSSHGIPPVRGKRMAFLW
jgi:acyl-CoA reductase-like NAD-dependent aldehyde dehydrogenase